MFYKLPTYSIISVFYYENLFVFVVLFVVVGAFMNNIMISVMMKWFFSFHIWIVNQFETATLFFFFSAESTSTF